LAATNEKPNILVVDDEPQITRVLKTTLASHGYSIRTARDGDEAVQLMKDWPPDLVITDLRMPNMDGLACAGMCAPSPKSRSSCFPSGAKNGPKWRPSMPALTTM